MHSCKKATEIMRLSALETTHCHPSDILYKPETIPNMKNNNTTRCQKNECALEQFLSRKKLTQHFNSSRLAFQHEIFVKD